jgi:hypothetical protein
VSSTITAPPARQFVLVCHCAGHPVFTYWSDRAEAEAARDELAPHGAKPCVAHTIAAVTAHPPPWHPAGRHYRTNKVAPR